MTFFDGSQVDETPPAIIITHNGDTTDVTSQCCDATVSRLVDYTDKHVFEAFADEEGFVRYRFVRIDAIDCAGPTWRCDECGTELADDRLDDAEETTT